MDMQKFTATRFKSHIESIINQMEDDKWVIKDPYVHLAGELFVKVNEEITHHERKVAKYIFLQIVSQDPELVSRWRKIVE